MLAANPIVIEAYWQTGKIILARQQAATWGAKVIDRLAADLQLAFPEMSGLSSRNLLSMKLFAEAFPDGAITKQPVSQLPWGQIIRLIQMVKDPSARQFYIREAITQGWSRSMLEIQARSGLHLRAGKAVNNFRLTMPPADSDMATQIFKDPYLFDFLGTADPRREAEVEQALVDHIQKFLLELGTGFAFVGRQVRLEVGDQDFALICFFITCICAAMSSSSSKPAISNQATSAKSTFIATQWRICCATPTTNPPLACCCAKARTAWSQNMRSTACNTPLLLRIGKPSSRSRYPSNCVAACPALRRSKRNWQVRS